LASSSMDGKPLSRRRNMTAESAVSSFAFKEASAPTFFATEPEVSQIDCESVEFRHPPGAVETYIIQEESDTDTLVLKSPDGEKSMRFALSGSREIEVRTTVPRIDRCPAFQKAVSTTT